MPRNPANHPLRLFARARERGEPLYIVGPMVRYSKLPFRATVRELSPDVLIYSPMILAREFVRSPIARSSDFSTNSNDTPLVVQFGANNCLDLTRAAKMIMPYCDGIGLNCGCPIKEQVREGIGAALMTEPELVSDMVRAVKEACGPEFCVEVKIRIHTDLSETIRFAQMVEAAGADYITVHGRRKVDRSSLPANFDAIAKVKAAVKCPVVSNGDCFEPEDVGDIIAKTKCDGVMAVRGALANPGLFAGFKQAPWKAVEIFLDHAMNYGLPFALIQHHLAEMMSVELTRRERRVFNECKSIPEIVDWLDIHFELLRRNEPGFGEKCDWPWRHTAREMLALEANTLRDEDEAAELAAKVANAKVDDE